MATTKKTQKGKGTTKDGIRRETTSQRPETTSRAAQIQMLVGTGMRNVAVWSAMEAQFPSIIVDDSKRADISGDPHLKYDKDLRGKISRDINSTRALAIKDDERIMGLVAATGGKGIVLSKTLDEIEMRNRHRFPWGLTRLDEIYGQTLFVHLEDHPNSTYRKETKQIKTRDDHGKVIFIPKESKTWLKGDWRAGDPMIPQGSGFMRTRNKDGTLRNDLPLVDQVVEHGCPEAYISIWGGAPGAGKSKLAIKASKAVIGSTQEAVLYVNGEAEEEEFRMWVGTDVDPDLFNTINEKLLPVSAIERVARKVKPRLIVIDSVQTLAEWNKGMRGQQSVMHILGALKMDPTAGRPHIILISQLNKQNELKGARDLEHLADSVAGVTQTDQEHVSQIEIVRKHRCGPTPVGFMFKHLLNDVELMSNRDVRRVAYDLNAPDGSAVANGITDLPLSSKETGTDDGEGEVMEIESEQE